MVRYCDVCGGEIVIRYVGGRLTPIHLDGSCSGWGGNLRARYNVSNGDGYTRPTKCSECGDAVFFIRHNGGSVWVDPPLGPPWNRHHCKHPPQETKHRSLAAEARLASEDTEDAVIGVVIRTEIHPLGAESYLFVDTVDGSLIVRVVGRAELAGELVVVQRDAQKVFYWKNRDITFTILSID